MKIEIKLWKQDGSFDSAINENQIMQIDLESDALTAEIWIDGLRPIDSVAATNDELIALLSESKKAVAHQATHTPGPWTVSNIGEVFAGKNTRICNPDQTGVDGMAKANARLIASSPDLLTALKNLLDVQDVDEHDSSEEMLSNPHETKDCVLCVAREAIAKAEGKS